MSVSVKHCGDETEHAAHLWSMPGGVLQCVGTTADGAEIARRARFASLPRWSPPPPVEWRSSACKRRHCIELAACTIDGEPFCIEHADEEIERACVEPGLARLLPELDE